MSQVQNIIGSGFGSAGKMSAAQLRTEAPSVFADHAAPGLSSRYQFVSTADVVASMADLGYYPVKAGQSRVVKATGAGYTKHVVRMMHEKYIDYSTREVGDVVPQILLTNSHDRSSSFQLTGGLERLWCKNGMATPVAGFAAFRVLHNDKEIHKHIAIGVSAVKELTDSFVLPQIERMTELELTPAQCDDFARAATVLKFGEVREVEAPLLLECRRPEDVGCSLWHVLNRVQENAVKGGYATVNAAGHNITSRGITSVARDYDFNMKLWTFGARVLADLA